MNSDKMHLYYLAHTWECIAMLEHLFNNESSSTNYGDRHWHCSRSLPTPDISIPEGNLRYKINVKSKNIVDRLYTLRPYTGNVQCLTRCECECVNLYRDYIWNHVLTCGYEFVHNCTCSSVCFSSCKVECMNGIEVTDWMRNQMLLKERMYCVRHNRFVRLHSENGMIANAIYGVETACKSIMDGVCYHTAIMMIYEDRSSRSLYGSDLHKGLAAFVRYNENRHDWVNRTVMVRESKLGIYRGFPD